MGNRSMCMELFARPIVSLQDTKANYPHLVGSIRHWSGLRSSAARQNNALRHLVEGILCPHMSPCPHPQCSFFPHGMHRLLMVFYHRH